MFVRSAGLCLFLTFLLSSAQAGVIVKVSDITWNEGAAGGLLDVFVRAETGTTVELDNFGFELQIAPVSTATRIDFAATQTLSGLTGEGNYVFFAGGGNPFASSVAPFNVVNGSDFSVTGPVTLGDSFKLLTRLELVPGAGVLAPVAGDQFKVSLSLDPIATLFDDGTFNNSIGFTAVDGLITVQLSPNVVPEPPSVFVALALAGCGLIGLRRKRKLETVQ